MKKYKVEISETAERDLEDIISYLKYNLAGDIIIVYPIIILFCFVALLIWNYFAILIVDFKEDFI